jgi:pimeloyl-ACP methyl ester carboxylesterase
LIVPSRFGYLRSSLPADASTAAQAETYAALLDALQIEKAWLVGLSAGGMSALHFARHFPQRCCGLIMISAICQPISQPSGLRFIVEHVLTNDFLGWYLATHHPRLVARSTGDDYALVEDDPARKAAFLSLAWPALASQRRAGMLNDFHQADSQTDDLQPLTCPLLVIHGTADPLSPFNGAQKLLALNPHAEKLIFADGGHLSFLLQQEQTKTAIMNFLGRLP